MTTHAAEPAQARDLDLTDRKLLNILQSKFPLAERPYLEIGKRLNLSEDEVIERVGRLRQKHVLRQIGAIFDTRRLGYKSTLVAMKFPPGRIAQGAQVISEHPGVSHNYERDHAYNLWFTLAVPPSESIEETVADMARRAGALAYRILPTLRFFKVGVNFDMVSQSGNSDQEVIGRTPSTDRSAVPVTDEEITVIKELQEDLPAEREPFKPMAQRLGISVPHLFACAERFMDRGLMRRYSAVLHHRRAGFRANAMAVWRVPPEQAQEAGDIMARSPNVSHCYQRPAYDDFPYSHYTMLHAATPEQCQAIAREISQATGITDYLMLFSSREFKKTRVKYFV